MADFTYLFVTININQKNEIMNNHSKHLSKLNTKEKKSIYGGSIFKDWGCRARKMWESVKDYMSVNEFSNYYTNMYNF